MPSRKPWICCLLLPYLFAPVAFAGEPTASWTLRLGYHEDGSMTSEWQEALQLLRGAAVQVGPPRPLEPEEARWESLIRERLASAWPERAVDLGIPFEGVRPPVEVVVLLGHQGGEDAFTCAEDRICFDLAALHRIYGAATEAGNRDRIDRFFAHEYTHLLHKAWRRHHPVELKTPLDEALWACLVEGIGNYRSLSAKWLTAEGRLTAHAEATLARLQPVFVERLVGLASASEGGASESEVQALMQGLSMGPFDQKWGALTTALWLAREAGGDDRKLRRWVEAGPGGILDLADRHLPEPLRRDLRLATRPRD